MSARSRSSIFKFDGDSDSTSIFSVGDDELIVADFDDFDSDDCLEDLPLSKAAIKVSKKCKAISLTHTNKRKRANSVSKTEKEILKAEKALEKIRKKEAKDLLKRIEPKTCMEYVTVKVDVQLFESIFGVEIIQSITQYGSKPEICKQDISHTITWTTKTVENGIEVDKEAAPVLIIWDEAQFANFMLEESIVNRIKSMQEKMPNKKFTLVIFGMESLLKELDKVDKDQFRNSVLGAETKRKRKLPKKYENINFLSRSVVEDIFVDLQLLNECCTRIADTVKDIGSVVHQFTKAIAETPFKLEKQKQQVDGLGWLATCDTKDCVRVNKSGNGLAQLWLHQLMQFNNSGLDIAQAIVQEYPTPLTLYKAYCKCDTSKKGEELLKDIIVRRGFGEAAAKRRVGPELSKKINYFLTGLDGDLPLSQE